MPSLPKLSGNDTLKLFQKIGYEIVRQKGSHCIIRKNNITFPVPLHKELDTGMLKGLIRQANLSNDEFIKLYNKR